MVIYLVYDSSELKINANKIGNRKLDQREKEKENEWLAKIFYEFTM